MQHRTQTWPIINDLRFIYGWLPESNFGPYVRAVGMSAFRAEPVMADPLWRYSGIMCSQTSRLLEAYDALPPEEKRIFTAEFLRRAIPFDSGPLDDEETAAAADALIAGLDADEHDATPR